LGAYVSNYNITFPTASLMPDGFTIMPCGCASLSIERDHRQLTVDLHGPVTKPYLMGGLTNQLELIVTIEFRPAGLYALTGISQSELTDQTVPFEAVNPVLSKLLAETIETADSIYGLAAGLDRVLMGNLYTAYHPQFQQMLQNINDCAGNITVKGLAKDIHYSERQMNRIFKQHMGAGTKSFARLIRINHSFRLLKKPHNLTLVSDLAGFHDLSHFIRDFQSVCGITPQVYRENMSDFYSNPKKF